MSGTFHGRIMNLPADDRGINYRLGHRDARHAAAELANEADAELDRLRTQLAAHANDIHTCGPTCSMAGCVNGRLREAAQALLRVHLDNADVHPCDHSRDDIRAAHCSLEVQRLYAALQEPTEDRHA